MTQTKKPQERNPAVLGVDCGDVILYTWGRRVPGSLASLRAIVQSGNFKEIYVISKANFFMRTVFLVRLYAMDFWSYTGIPREHLRFCLHYEDKAPICEDLGVTHFVDDRLRVLRRLTTVPHRYIFRKGGPRPQEVREYGTPSQETAIEVDSWAKLEELLLRGV
jgi:hypothetical protein